MRKIIKRNKLFWLGLACLSILVLCVSRISSLNHEDLYAFAGSNMDQSLRKLKEVYVTMGPESAQTFADLHGILMEGDRIQVVAETDSAGGMAEANLRASILSQEIVGLGGEVQAVYRHMVQNMISLDALSHLAGSANVEFVRPPLRPISLIQSEGVETTGADLWHSTPGYRGGGRPAKVCVLDLGFKGYKALLGNELPNSVITKSFRADGDIEAGEPHGTACAEIIHDMAPDAQLYFLNFSTDVEHHNAVTWIISSGVDLVSYSLGWLNAGPGDGTGPICQDVNRIHEAGILWVSAAGNNAQTHWRGNFKDRNGNKWLEFGSTKKESVEYCAFWVEKGFEYSIWLSWDDWGEWNGSDFIGAEGNDYDLYLYNKDKVEIAKSNFRQTQGAYPIEGLIVAPKSRGWRYIRIRERKSSRDCRLNVFFEGIRDLEYVNPHYSINVPADSPYAIAVGATDWGSDNFHVYTSRGPTSDGRIKPNLCAPSGVSTSTYGKFDFYGTSSSTAHVSGAIALLRSKTMYSFGQILEIIRSRALDLAPAGKDNIHGIGRLKLDN